MPFIQDDNNENENQAQTMTGGGTGGAGGGQAASTPMNTQNKQGSGRFTNLNKYVGANQQGSQNLANRLGTGIQNQLDTSNKEATQQGNKVDESITSGREAINTADKDIGKLQSIGDQFKPGFAASQVYDPNARGGFSSGMQAAQDFTKSPDFSNFQTFQKGNAIDNNAVQTNVQGANTSAQALQDQYLNRQKQAGTGDGRQQLLGEFVGGGNSAVRPGYSTGQKKLDNLILSQNTGNLKNLINQVGSNEGAVNTTVNRAGQLTDAAGNLLSDEDSRIGTISNTAKANQAAFQGAFGADKVAQVNSDRANNYNKIADQLRTGNINTELYNQLGLNNAFNPAIAEGDHLGAESKFGYGDIGFDRKEGDTSRSYQGLNTYGLIDQIQNNPALMNSYVNRKADLTDTNQLGQQADVNTDSALESILGVQGGRKFTSANDISSAANVAKDAQGNTSLLNDINKRRQQALQVIKENPAAQGFVSPEQQASSNAINERFRQLFGSGVGENGFQQTANQNILRRPT